LTGYFAVFPKKDIIFLKMSIEEGLRLVISGGVVNPESGIDKNQKSAIVNHNL